MDLPNAAVAALASQLLVDQQARDALFVSWLTGTADGGPAGDGRYPLPHPSGALMVPCWAAVCDPLTGATADAQASAEEASEAVQAKTDTLLCLVTVEQLLAEARTLRAQTQLLRQEAASEHAAARAEREACQQLKSDMQTMLDAWATANP